MRETFSNQFKLKTFNQILAKVYSIRWEHLTRKREDVDGYRIYHPIRPKLNKKYAEQKKIGSFLLKNGFH
jgi:hypothetical protein